MKYVKQHFVTGMKVSLPDVLNRMEAKTPLLSLLAGTAPDKDAALSALRAEWGVADRSTDTETAAAAPGAAGADTEAASAERGA